MQNWMNPEAKMEIPDEYFAIRAHSEGNTIDYPDLFVEGSSMTPAAKYLILLLVLMSVVSPAQNHSVNTSASPQASAEPASSSVHPHPFDRETQPGVGTLQSNAEGFDMQIAPTTRQMWTWWLYSPYSDIGAYFGGCNVYSQSVVGGQPSPDQCGTSPSGTKHPSAPRPATANYNLNNDWITSVAEQGWGVMPLWVGPQATNAADSPCYYYDKQKYPNGQYWGMDSTTSGKIEADSAMARAASLGVSYGVVYYDMEPYDSSTCSAQVTVFLGAWTQELQLYGFKAGVYGSIGNINDLESFSVNADAVWVADWSLNGGQPWNWQTASISYISPPWNYLAWQYCSDGTSTPCSGGSPPGDQWPSGSEALSIDGDVENTLVLAYGSNRELPFTSLISPAYGATEQSTTPQFAWAPVKGAFQYNLAIATSISALPTSYTQMSFPACTMFVSMIKGTSYTIPSGILQLGATYYWEVQADSGTFFPGMSVKGGDWTLPYSLTIGGSATGIQSVSVNPSSLGSGSYTVVTVTLNGIAPSNGTTVTLASSNGTAIPLPPSVKVPANQNTASVSVLSGSVTTSTTVTVSASYSGTQTTTVTVVPNSGVLTTTAASGITGSAAVLNGTVNPRGADGQYQLDRKST